MQQARNIKRLTPAILFLIKRHSFRVLRLWNLKRGFGNGENNPVASSSRLRDSQKRRPCLVYIIFGGYGKGSPGLFTWMKRGDVTSFVARLRTPCRPRQNGYPAIFKPLDESYLFHVCIRVRGWLLLRRLTGCLKATLSLFLLRIYRLLSKLADFYSK